MDGNLAKVMAWCDNETGFSHRLQNLAVHLGGR
jgi:glyceraldehyde-3-phosphate dehydrogenase/erythrose-4-phosphate dehydrogenase